MHRPQVVTAADRLPDPGHHRTRPVAIAAVAALLILRLRWSVRASSASCAVLGVAAALAGLRPA